FKSMKRWTKIFTSATVSIVPIAAIIYFSTPWNKVSMISLVGSSSLQPLVSKFSDEYSQSDLIVQGGGSGFGIKSIVSQTTDIGLSSKDPYESVRDATIQTNDFDIQDWINESIKTFTIAIDSIALVYKSNQSLNITNNNIGDVYRLFCGLDFYTISNGDLKKADSARNSLVPYSRTGGSNSSGTAFSFMNQFIGWNWDENNNVYSKEYEILKYGKYGKNVRSTNESNVETLNKLMEENLDGGITYLSLSFVIENYETITKAGYKVASVNGINIDNDFYKNPEITLDFIKKYGWFYFYNIIVSQNCSAQVKDLIDWIYFKEGSNVIENLNLFPIYSSKHNYLDLLQYQNYQDEITENNFNSVFFSKENSDGALAEKGQWPENFSFGVSNEKILNYNVES
ncbi:MAG: substrate-binding domain-containing protein, partial [Malacoplasma sp.]|nr:substrate-binding domain-containing protein [Malacoplasma sp.]